MNLIFMKSKYLINSKEFCETCVHQRVNNNNKISLLAILLNVYQ